MHFPEVSGSASAVKNIHVDNLEKETPSRVDFSQRPFA